VLDRVRERRCDVAVVDPTEAGEQLTTIRIDALAATLSRPAVAIVAYVPFTVAGMRAVHGLTRIGATEIIIRGVDDSAELLTAAIHRALSASLADSVVSDVRDSLRFTAGALGTAVELLFRRPERFRSVSDLASAAGITRRSLDRCLARAGLAPARTLLACARANVAFHLLAGGQVRKTRAASLVGYPSARSLTRELRELTGRSAADIPAQLSLEAFAALLRRRLTRSPPALAASVAY